MQFPHVVKNWISSLKATGIGFLVTEYLTIFCHDRGLRDYPKCHHHVLFTHLSTTWRKLACSNFSERLYLLKSSWLLVGQLPKCPFWKWKSRHDQRAVSHWQQNQELYIPCEQRKQIGEPTAPGNRDTMSLIQLKGMFSSPEDGFFKPILPHHWPNYKYSVSQQGKMPS